MNKTKNESKEKKTYDVEAFMKYAINIMFTQIQDKQGFHLQGKRVVVSMIKELKNWKKDLFQEKSCDCN